MMGIINLQISSFTEKCKEGKHAFLMFIVAFILV